VAAAEEVAVVFGALYPLQSAIAYCERHVVLLSQSFFAWSVTAVEAAV
jgi:hypothetical protein